MNWVWFRAVSGMVAGLTVAAASLIEGIAATSGQQTPLQQLTVVVRGRPWLLVLIVAPFIFLLGILVGSVACGNGKDLHP